MNLGTAVNMKVTRPDVLTQQIPLNQTLLQVSHLLPHDEVRLIGHVDRQRRRVLALVPARGRGAVAGAQAGTFE